jgi:hypothetical protein
MPIFGCCPIICLKWVTSWITSIRINQFPNRDSNPDCDTLPQPNQTGMYVVNYSAIFSFWALQKGAAWTIMRFLHTVYEVNAFWWNLVRTAFHWRLPQTRTFLISYNQWYQNNRRSNIWGGSEVSPGEGRWTGVDKPLPLLDPFWPLFDIVPVEWNAANNSATLL